MQVKAYSESIVGMKTEMGGLRSEHALALQRSQRDFERMQQAEAQVLALKDEMEAARIAGTGASEKRPEETERMRKEHMAEVSCAHKKNSRVRIRCYDQW